jgi:hypothetical protein
MLKVVELKTEAADSIEMLINMYQNKWRHISDASNLHSQGRDDLKSHFAKWFPAFRLHKRNRR